MERPPAGSRRERASGGGRVVLRLFACGVGEQALVDLLRVARAEIVEELLLRLFDALLVECVADLRGDVMVAQGKIAEARAAYKTAIDKSLPNSSYRNVVQIKLDALGDDK